MRITHLRAILDSLSNYCHAYALIDESGEILREYYYHCFAKLLHCDVLNVQYFIVKIQPHKRINLKIAHTYLHWLLNDSPWSNVFLSKNVKETYRRGCIVRTNYPASFIIQALAIYRYVMEFPGRVESWYYINNIIRHPLLSLILVHFYRFKDNKWNQSCSYLRGHWFSYMNKHTINNMLNNKTTRLKETFKNNQNYKCLDKTWGGGCFHDIINVEFIFTNQDAIDWRDKMLEDAKNA